jgi:CheY-like chemotaxis protein
MRVRVLVVDDNVGFLAAVRGILEAPDLPFVVHTEESASAALAYLEKSGQRPDAPQPAFIILVFYLPDMNAPALLERMRAMPGFEGLPVLAVSQADWEGEESRVRAAGANRFRVKPSRVAALREVLVSFCREEVYGCSDPLRPK